MVAGKRIHQQVLSCRAGGFRGRDGVLSAGTRGNVEQARKCELGEVRKRNGPCIRVAMAGFHGWCHMRENWRLPVAGAGDGRSQGLQTVVGFFTRLKK